MNFTDRLRNFFGIPSRSDNTNNFERRNYTYDEEDDTYNNEIPRRGFDIFTDPLQMQQYFEQQMSELLRNFGFQEFGDSMFGGSFSFNLPEIEEGSPEIPNGSNSQDLRDQFLKPGYEEQRNPHDKNEKLDKSMDDEIKAGGIDSILKNKQVVPHHSPSGTKFFSGQSMSSKTIRNADGSMETHKTVRDSEGNEETTICKRMGDKEYTVIKKRDRNGQEEIIENFVNMDESEKSSFLQSNNQNVPRIDEKPHNFYPFDKFFR